MVIINPDDLPSEVKLVNLLPVVLEYRTFEDDVKPDFAVYYLFSGGRNMGIYREYKCDVDSFVRRKGERVFPYGDLDFFRGEKKFLDKLIEKNVQGVYLRLVDGVSFNDLASVASEIHGSQVFRKYSVLRDIGIRGLKEMFDLVDRDYNDYFFFL